jgi:hypothetical protein
LEIARFGDSRSNASQCACGELLRLLVATILLSFARSLLLLAIRIMGFWVSFGDCVKASR